MHILYNILAVLLVIIAMPVFVFRMIREAGFGERLRQSFGFIPEETLARVAGKGAIWLHAASVGEIVATSPIVKEIRKELPDAPIMISVVTASGYAMAKRIIKEADAVIFFPIDVPCLGSRVIDRIKPRVFLPVETELWPNFLKSARKHKLPVMMVNGRISDKSVERYRHLGSVLTDMMNTVNRFCMQSDIDKEYILRLGADPSRVVVTGNTKFDQTYTDVSHAEKNQLITEMGLADSWPVILAGSTHKGEEEVVFVSFTKIKEDYPNAKLVIAPREIMRTDEIISLAENHKLTAARRTKLQQNQTSAHDVVILDTIGELGKVYSLGDIVFVGGSLIQHGGHNILEPAAHGKPIIVGPNMFNFKDSYFLFSNRGACVTVKDSRELTAQTLNILNNDEIRRAMSDETTAIINENRGASHKSAIYLKELLELSNTN